eukprot:TRINITY_DN3871_c0_g4_i1.p1 TRINITY_DN3871_c0_g4~~TRINITY_DN3871_c0_g4_i1.p1  ORF type:complete len:411 (+),score=60.71 TRINITY_DN3871_c0_g4_i1:66-1298(+)
MCIRDRYMGNRIHFMYGKPQAHNQSGNRTNVDVGGILEPRTGTGGLAGNSGKRYSGSDTNYSNTSKYQTSPGLSGITSSYGEVELLRKGLQELQVINEALNRQLSEFKDKELKYLEQIKGLENRLEKLESIESRREELPKGLETKLGELEAKLRELQHHFSQEAIQSHVNNILNSSSKKEIEPELREIKISSDVEESFSLKSNGEVLGSGAVQTKNGARIENGTDSFEITTSEQCFYVQCFASSVPAYFRVKNPVQLTSGQLIVVRSEGLLIALTIRSVNESKLVLQFVEVESPFSDPFEAVRAAKSERDLTWIDIVLDNSKSRYSFSTNRPAAEYKLGTANENSERGFEIRFKEKKWTLNACKTEETTVLVAIKKFEEHLANRPSTRVLLEKEQTILALGRQFSLIIQE